MSYAVAGAFGGLLMAAVSALVVPLMLFFLVKDPSPTFQAVLERVPPMYMTMGLIVLAYPLWTVLGAVIGLLYGVSATQASESGLGSPNLIFTLTIVAVAAAVAVPLALLMRRVVAGLAALALTFAGVFGWMLPYVAG